MKEFKDFKIIREDVSFSEALNGLKNGYVISRKGWNGRGMFLYKVDSANYKAMMPVAKAIYGEDALVPYEPYIAMKNAMGTINVWNPAQMDMFTDDWMILDIEVGMNNLDNIELDE